MRRLKSEKLDGVSKLNKKVKCNLFKLSQWNLIKLTSGTNYSQIYYIWHVKQILTTNILRIII